MKTIFSALLILILTACMNTEKENLQTLLLTNTTDMELTDKPVSIGRDALSKVGALNTYAVLRIESDTIPSQMNDTDGDGNWDELFFTVNFTPNEQKNVTLLWVNEKPIYKVRTNARFGKRDTPQETVTLRESEVLLYDQLPKSIGFHQYQTDGPMWENDKVGFRHYLDGRNAKDLFGKKTSDMSPDTTGVDSTGAIVDNFHVMKDWGRDILAVGNSLGIGGFALQTNTELLRLGVTFDDAINTIEKTTFKINYKGPIKAELSYTYDHWKPKNNTYFAQEKTTIFPGIYGYKNTVSVANLVGDENLVVGIPKIHTDKPLSVFEANEDFVILYTHDQQTYDKEWWLGMALLLPKTSYLGFTEAPATGSISTAFLGQLKISNNVPISYYVIACWELSDPNFKDETYFKNYLKQTANQLSAKINIEVIY